MSQSMSASGLQIVEEGLGSDYHQFPSSLNVTKPSISSHQDSPLDLICIGFGPASLAVAIALSEFPSKSARPTSLFLERQPAFAWHSGMQLPGAKMQISFLKDLATPRNPRSHFTFINYLQSKGRFHEFANLGTFTPRRMEYEDYLRWCAGYFERDGNVGYGMEVVDVAPLKGKAGKVDSFKVTARNLKTGEIAERIARHVVIAVGGKGYIPKELPQSHAKVVHSSQYSMRVASALPNPSAKYNIAVVGNGQSAAEIFNDLPSKYPNANVTIIIKGSALRPSDDSPFVNEVFNPDRVDSIYQQNSEQRLQGIKADRATNYGAVRIDLLEHLYEQLYFQKMKNPDQKHWKIKIQTNRQVVESREDGNGSLVLKLAKLADDGTSNEGGEEIAFDAVFVATGYVRNAHEEMLKKTRGLLPTPFQAEGSRMPVQRDYRIEYDEKKVEADVGVWLQGCNENTHGLSDTLLSILAIRGGELVQSIFGGDSATGMVRAKL